MSNDISKRNGIISKLVWFQQFLGVFMLCMLVTLVFVQVLLRTFNFPLMGIEELLILPTIWLYMMGAANASEERSHISVDILEVFLKNETVLTISSFVKNIVSFFIGIILTYWMFNYISYSFTVWKLTPLLSLPVFFLESALFVGVLLMTLYTLADLVVSVKTTKNYFKNTNRKGEI